MEKTLFSDNSRKLMILMNNPPDLLYDLKL